MDSPTQDIYLQKIQEQIEDEDKIVTLSALAKNLQISVQDSAQILNQYFKDNRTLKPDTLAATYILSGTLKNSNTKSVCLVKDVDIKSKKEEFEEITSETLYSIQKGKDVDFNVIAIADWPNFTDSQEKPMPLFGTVVSKNCTRRTIKHKILPPPTPATLKGKSSFFAPKTEPKAGESSSEGSSGTNNTKKASEGKTGTISSLFSKAPEVKKEPQKKATETKPVAKEKPAKGGLSTFFSKSSSITSNGSTKSEDIPNKEKSKTDSNKISKDNSNINSEDIDFGSDIEMQEVEKKVLEEKPKNSSPEKKINKKDKRKSTKRIRDKSAEKSSKRRKRIIERHESDSDDIFENDENNEDVIEKSDDEVQRNPSPVPLKPLAPKNKKRVAVDRSYVDEEGFMVTKREYVYESASEEESEIVQPVKTGEKPQPKPIEKQKSTSSGTDSSPQTAGKGKKAKKNTLQGQQTLMSFFKKK